MVDNDRLDLKEFVPNILGMRRALQIRRNALLHRREEAKRQQWDIDEIEAEMDCILRVLGALK